MIRVSTSLLARLMLPIAVAMLAPPASAQDKAFEPQVGQQGKDVIWVPTPDDIVERMLRMAQTTPNDYVVDRFKDWSHSGHVTLARGERSRLADHAAEVL